MAIAVNQSSRQLNLTISALTKIAVVGASGRGKTTLVKLLTGLLQPTHGGIYWDQMPYPEIDGGSLRNQITYIDQSPYLFNASIRFNITLGDPFTDRQLNQVLTLCQLTTFVANQPHGLEPSSVRMVAIFLAVKNNDWF